MEYINTLNKFTKATLIAGLSLIIFGFIVRKAGIYFFWESSPIGWLFIIIGLVGLLANRIKYKKANGKKRLWEKIGIGFFGLILFIKTLLLFIVPFSGAYQASKEYIKTEPSIISEIGVIKSTTPKPSGSLETTNGYGTASLDIMVKGERKFIEVTVISTKNPGDAGWQVKQVIW